MNVLWHGLLRWRLPAAGFALAAAFAILAGRFWHPYYGFTKFVQLDEADQRTAIPEIRENAVFAYRGFNGYDGAAYTQLAFHPLLGAPELKPALDNLPYRARRILGSALAWILAGGQPARIAGTYAALNLGVWFILAALLWRVLPVTDARSWAAWAGVMFSAGALHSVRLALTDLLATTLMAAALWLAETGRARRALGFLAAASLARETVLTGLVALCRGPLASLGAWRANLVRAGLATLPLAAWMLYVRWQAGPADQGFGNFSWPGAAWIEKWSETLADYARHPEFRGLITATLLATVALTVQAVYVLRQPRWQNAWWRAGAAGVLLMALLGTAVWEGHPGAATRVLLPLGVVFAVLVVRDRASWAWIAAGSLSVGSGVLALREVPQDPREIAAGRCAGGAFVARIEEGWFGVERRGSAAWSWTGNRGTVVVEIAPRRAAPAKLRLKLRAITPREVEVRVGDTVLWRGTVGETAAWIEAEAPAPSAPGRHRIELRSAAAAVPESRQPGARALGLAVQGLEVK